MLTSRTPTAVAASCFVMLGAYSRSSSSSAYGESVSLYESDTVPSGYACASSLPPRFSRRSWGLGELNELSQSMRDGPWSLEWRKQGELIAGEGARR